MNAQLDVIVRFHNVARLPELERCLLSLIGQAYRPLSIFIVTQRFDAAATKTVQTVLDTLQLIEPDVTIAILNYADPEPADARSSLINMGFAEATGRYAALLDYDDIMTTNGYTRLVNDLAATGTAISFGRIIGARLMVDGPLLMTRTRQPLYDEGNVISLLRQNFCPIHSFVIDRTRIDPTSLYFDPSLSRNEDYDFLIRTCADYPASFGQGHYTVGYYCLKDDGSNTVVAAGQVTAAQWEDWKCSDRRIERLRNTKRVSLRVQRYLGRTPDPELTVAQLIGESGP